MVITHFEPMNTITQIVLICIVIIGAILFWLYVFNPALSNFFLDMVTEQVVIFESANGICKVDTGDETAISKTIVGCNIPTGTVITIKYTLGNSYAQISLP